MKRNELLMFDLSICRDLDKKGFVDPIRTLTLAHLKQEQTDRSRTPTDKEMHLNRLFLDPHGKTRLANTQVYCAYYGYHVLLLALHNSSVTQHVPVCNCRNKYSTNTYISI